MINWFESLPDSAKALFLVGCMLFIVLISSILKRTVKWEKDPHEDTDYSQFIDTTELKK